ncbi:MAG: hypothetical protein GWN97_22515 [Thermoplasmata archaeon]|nr:hypothetical protein [Thermoplasmata archaeon]NIT80345.1 hypothetical protein [Thermoplasmata archaeon]NIY06713.1 hypothetical protein [Thermoplasmata archaeon]
MAEIIGTNPTDTYQEVETTHGVYGLPPLTQAERHEDETVTISSYVPEPPKKKTTRKKSTTKK